MIGQHCLCDPGNSRCTVSLSLFLILLTTAYRIFSIKRRGTYLIFRAFSAALIKNLDVTLEILSLMQRYNLFVGKNLQQ